MRATLAVVAVSLIGLQSAAAEIEATISIVAGAGTGAPQLEATVIGAPRLPLDQITLRDARGVSVPASEVREFKDGKRTIAVAVVFNGQEIWVGNDQFEGYDSPARYLGALEGVRKGIDALDLARTTPPGSQAVLITYADNAEIRFPLGPAANLTGAAVGKQRDYYGKLGYALVEGTTLGISELALSRAHKKLMIVVSDGSDTNAETARGAFAALKKRAAQEGIEIAAIIYKGALSEPGNPITALVPNAVTVFNDDAIATAMRDALRRSTSEYSVRFPGERLRWDGTAQELTLQFGSEQTEPLTLQMGPKPAPGRAWYFRWWAQLAAGLVLVGAVLLGLRLRGGRTAL